MIRVSLEQLFDENKRPMPGAGEIVIPGATMSLMAERDLLACYLDIANMWARLVRGRVIPAWKTPQIGDAAGSVAADADGSQLQWLIDQVDREVQARVIYQTERMGRWVTGAATRQRLQVIAKTKSATGLDISPFIRMSDVEGILRDSIRENTALITNLSQDAKRRVEQVIFNGFAFRWNKKRITDEIAKAMGITKRRARTIATDQAHKLQARLNQYRNEQLGIKEYIWRTMRDDRVRREHRNREGKRFRWSSPPPDGHPGEPINCFPASTEIDLSNGCDQLYRRHYSGPMVTIAGEWGSLQSTPNHPVMTGGGWIPVHALKQGNYVVRRVGNGHGIDKHDNHQLMSFGNLFEALKISEAVQSSRGSKFDFHGDGTEGNIDVVSVNGFLPNNTVAAFFKGLRDFGFAGTCHDFSGSILNRLRGSAAKLPEIVVGFIADSFMRSHSAARAFLRCHALVHGHHRLRYAADGDPMAFEHGGYGCSADPVSTGQSKHVFTGTVTSNHFRFGQGKFVRSRRNTTRNNETGSAELFAKCVRAAHKEGRKIFEFASVLYEFARVDECFVTDFSGHVFNLSNDRNWYLANAVVAHNCRCHAEAVFRSTRGRNSREREI